MKKSLLFLLIPTLLLAGCRGGRGHGSSVVPPTSDNPTSVTTGSTPTSGSTTGGSSGTTGTTGGSSTTGSSGSTGSSSSSSSSSSTSIIPPLEYKTISELNSIGNTIGSSLPSGTHESFNTDVIATRGRVIQAIAIGVSQQILVYICDADDMIPILTAGTSDFYSACKNYIGKETSNYIIQGHIGYYYGQPTIQITNYELKTDMTYDIDYSKFTSTEYTAIDTYNTYLKSLDYNKKGYGEGSLVTLKNMLCIAKADDNSWLFSDGNYVQGVYHQTSNTAFNIGQCYNLFGISCLYQWKPSLRTLNYSYSYAGTTVDIESLAIEKTATQMYSIGAFTDDTEKCVATNNFVDTFKFFYKSTVYFNHYGQAANGYYTVAGDNYYSSEISSKNTASDNRMFLFNNESMNKYTSLSYVPVRDYIQQNFTLTMYFVEYQFTQANKRMMPQVYMFEDFVQKLTFPDVELRKFFTGQTYLLDEGILPIIDDSYVGYYKIYNVTEMVFHIIAYEVSLANFQAHVSACSVNTNLTILESDTYSLYYKHSQANPKFKYRISYVPEVQAMTIIYEHYGS